MAKKCIFGPETLFSGHNYLMNFTIGLKF